MSATDEAIARWRSNIPEELWSLPAWLLWKKVPKANRPGKFDKVPFYADGCQRYGAQGRPEERVRLVEFGDALAAYAERETLHGIGLALLPDIPDWALDLDDCIDSAGTLSDVARRVVDSGTYAERSPSGAGVRALFAGKVGIDAKNHEAGVEVFDSRGFVTLTGDRIGGESLLPCPPALLEKILETVQASRSKSIPPAEALPAPPENPELTRDVRLPLALWRRLENPYPPGADRSAAAFSIALQLSRAGLTREQALELLSTPEVLAPALERRGGDIVSARAWMHRYVVLPAYQGNAHGR